MHTVSAYSGLFANVPRVLHDSASLALQPSVTQWNPNTSHACTHDDVSIYALQVVQSLVLTSSKRVHSGWRIQYYNIVGNVSRCSVFVDGQSFPLHFTDVWTHAHYVLYNWAYFAGLISWFDDCLQKQWIMDPSKISCYQYPCCNDWWLRIHVQCHVLASFILYMHPVHLRTHGLLWQCGPPDQGGDTENCWVLPFPGWKGQI